MWTFRRQSDVSRPDFPLAARQAIITRLADLLPVVRGATYFPALGFTNSIQSVAPALCPDVTYEDLEDIADGGTAAAAFLQLASGKLILRDDIDRVRAAVLVYCQHYMLALVGASRPDAARQEHL